MKWHVIFFFVVLFCIGIFDTEAACKKPPKRRGRGKRAADAEQKTVGRINRKYIGDQEIIEIEDMTSLPENF
ncbi:unnamed protein product [Cylicocyclus nassatus]|uniref:Uncharacterized protein n=1 Tax=Cylicocyclus nassatus TaxID=53992 RepID=A0AA36GEN3_CYLNA|nr:unnamed protein product [Cylicocyclus nassatus]CAJ0589509.1 unnamed protein product [Cylicocyclus nassatus]